MLPPTLGSPANLLETPFLASSKALSTRATSCGRGIALVSATGWGCVVGDVCNKATGKEKALVWRLSSSFTRNTPHFGLNLNLVKAFRMRLRYSPDPDRPGKWPNAL